MLQDIEKPRKEWASEMLRLMTEQPEENKPGKEEGAQKGREGPEASDETEAVVNNLTDRQIMKLLKRHYISCDTFQDCSPEIKAQLLAMRRRNKLRWK